MSKIRILCSADLHLGRSSAIGAEFSSVDGSATAAWARIVDLAVREEVDAVVLAGDVFDGRGSFQESRNEFLSGLSRLETAAIPVIAVAGNHDWDVLPLAAKMAGSNFHFLGKDERWERKVVQTKGGPVCFVGWSFRSEHVKVSQLPLLKRGDESVPVVGIVHGDPTPGSNYHPILTSEMIDKADGWVLGHLHKSFALHPKAVYPGSPQSLDFGVGERGIHGVVRLELENGVARFSDVLPLSSVRFEFVTIDVPFEDGRDPAESAFDLVREKCLDLCQPDTAVSVQLRAELIFHGIETPPNLEGDRVHVYLETHGIFIHLVRVKRIIDPWSLKDLRSKFGEAARLLIGAKSLSGQIADPEFPAPPQEWIDAARKIVEQSARDIESHYRRTLEVVSDQGESKIESFTEVEKFDLARTMIVDELESILQEASL
jgi:DNA repair exonuclease SbcCD nuclease subunit